jgi:hypothetical protein
VLACLRLNLFRQTLFDGVVSCFWFENYIEFHFFCFLPKITQVVLIPELSDFRVRASF